MVSMVFFMRCSEDEPEVKVQSNQSTFNVTNSGASSYVFNGAGLENSNDPALTLQRDKTYTFTLNASCHTFYLKTSQVTGDARAYYLGVTNNSIAIGTISFNIPADAPNTLYYICSIHSYMTGLITITD